jgi:ParB-like chromosome segregation protein Spo0J
MHTRVLMAAVAMFLWTALLAADKARAGPFQGGPKMAEEKKAADVPERATQATQKQLVTVALQDLPDPREVDDGLGNRFREKYQAANLGDLLESIRLRGLTDPPIVAKGEDGKWRIVGGHRRITVLYIHAEGGVPGFSREMPVQCLEMVNATEVELLIASMTSNELTARLDVKERLLWVKKAVATGVPKNEIAATTQFAVKSIERDLRIVTNERVLKHVLDDHLGPTAAAALVEVAAKKERLDEFLAYFDAWVQLKKEQIEQEARRAKEQGGVGLKPNQLTVASRLEPHLVRGWLKALATGNALKEESDLGFEASFDKKTGVAKIRLKLDAKADDPDYVGRAAAQVSQIAKHLAAFAQTRRALEAPEGPQAALQNDDALLDTALLKQYGLEDIADQLNQ